MMGCCDLLSGASATAEAAADLWMPRLQWLIFGLGDYMVLSGTWNLYLTAKWSVTKSNAQRQSVLETSNRFFFLAVKNGWPVFFIEFSSGIWRNRLRSEAEFFFIFFSSKSKNNCKNISGFFFFGFFLIISFSWFYFFFLGGGLVFCSFFLFGCFFFVFFFFFLVFD